MYSAACIADFYSVDLQLKGYDYTRQQAGLGGRTQEPQLYEAKTFQRPQAPSCACPKVSTYCSAGGCWAVFPHGQEETVFLWGVRSRKQLTPKSPWYHRVKGTAEGRALRCVSCSQDRPVTRISFLLLSSRVDNSYHSTFLLSKLSWAHTQGSTAKRSLFRMRWITWTR